MSSVSLITLHCIPSNLQVRPEGGEIILAVIGYAIYLIQIYVAKPLCFLCENTFLFLEDKWELPMGSRGTVILLLFGVKKQV